MEVSYAIGVPGVRDNIMERKEMEESLARPKEEVTRILESISDAFYSLDEDWRFTYVNGEAERFLLKSREALIGTSVWDQFPRALGTSLQTECERAVREQVAVQFEYYSPVLDGWFEVRAYPYERGLSVYFRDITERKAAADALQRSEFRLKRSQEIAHVGSWELDLLTNHLSWSDEAYRIFGLQPQEFGATYEAFLEAVHPDDRAAVDDAYAGSLRKGQDSYEIEHRVVRKDNGEIRYVHEKCDHIRDASGRIIRSVGMVQDITERRLAETALRVSEDRFRSIVETTSEWIWEMDLQGRSTYSNPAIEAILGVKPEEIIGVDTATLVHEDDRPKALDVLAKSTARAQGWKNLVLRWRHKDGSYRWLESSAVPVFGENDELVAFRGADRDITESKQEEEAVARSAERDRHIADMLQQTLIPREAPLQPPGYQIAVRYQPASREAEVCGDFYDIIDLGDGKLGIVIGDVVGKGLAAAARVASARQTIRSYAFLNYGPADVMTLVNDTLRRDAASESDLYTAFFALLDVRAGKLTYANAGHEPPVLWCLDGRTELLTRGGPMLSGIGLQAYREGVLVLDTGDVVVLVTDGITEARVANTYEFFGAEGVMHCISDLAGAAAEQIAGGILECATSFAKGELRDDAAIVVVRRSHDTVDGSPFGGGISEGYLERRRERERTNE